jgi:hypothetical protein
LGVLLRPGDVGTAGERGGDNAVRVERLDVLLALDEEDDALRRGGEQLG